MVLMKRMSFRVFSFPDLRAKCKHDMTTSEYTHIFLGAEEKEVAVDDTQRFYQDPYHVPLPYIWSDYFWDLIDPFYLVTKYPARFRHPRICWGLHRDSCYKFLITMFFVVWFPFFLLLLSVQHYDAEKYAVERRPPHSVASRPQFFNPGDDELVLDWAAHLYLLIKHLFAILVIHYVLKNSYYLAEPAELQKQWEQAFFFSAEAAREQRSLNSIVHNIHLAMSRGMGPPDKAMGPAALYNQGLRFRNYSSGGGDHLDHSGGPGGGMGGRETEIINHPINGPVEHEPGVMYNGHHYGERGDVNNATGVSASSHWEALRKKNKQGTLMQKLTSRNLQALNELHEATREDPGNRGTRPRNNPPAMGGGGVPKYGPQQVFSNEANLLNNDVVAENGHNNPENNAATRPELTEPNATMENEEEPNGSLKRDVSTISRRSRRGSVPRLDDVASGQSGATRAVRGPGGAQVQQQRGQQPIVGGPGGPLPFAEQQHLDPDYVRRRKADRDFFLRDHSDSQGPEDGGFGGDQNEYYLKDNKKQPLLKSSDNNDPDGDSNDENGKKDEKKSITYKALEWLYDLVPSEVLVWAFFGLCYPITYLYWFFTPKVVGSFLFLRFLGCCAAMYAMWLKGIFLAALLGQALTPKRSSLLNKWTMVLMMLDAWGECKWVVSVARVERSRNDWFMLYLTASSYILQLRILLAFGVLLTGRSPPYVRQFYPVPPEGFVEDEFEDPLHLSGNPNENRLPPTENSLDALLRVSSPDAGLAGGQKGEGSPSQTRRGAPSGSPPGDDNNVGGPMTTTLVTTQKKSMEKNNMLYYPPENNNTTGGNDDGETRENGHLTGRDVPEGPGGPQPVLNARHDVAAPDQGAGARTGSAKGSRDLGSKSQRGPRVGDLIWNDDPRDSSNLQINTNDGNNNNNNSNNSGEGYNVEQQPGMVGAYHNSYWGPPWGLFLKSTNPLPVHWVYFYLLGPALVGFGFFIFCWWWELYQSRQNVGVNESREARLNFLICLAVLMPAGGLSLGCITLFCRLQRKADRSVPPRTPLTFEALLLIVLYIIIYILPLLLWCFKFLYPMWFVRLLTSITHALCPTGILVYCLAAAKLPSVGTGAMSYLHFGALLFLVLIIAVQWKHFTCRLSEELKNVFKDGKDSFWHSFLKWRQPDNYDDLDEADDGEEEDGFPPPGDGGEDDDRGVKGGFAAPGKFTKQLKGGFKPPTDSAPPKKRKRKGPRPPGPRATTTPKEEEEPINSDSLIGSPPQESTGGDPPIIPPLRQGPPTTPSSPSRIPQRRGSSGTGFHPPGDKTRTGEEGPEDEDEEDEEEEAQTLQPLPFYSCCGPWPGDFGVLELFDGHRLVGDSDDVGQNQSGGPRNGGDDPENGLLRNPFPPRGDDTSEDGMGRSPRGTSTDQNDDDKSEQKEADKRVPARIIMEIPEDAVLGPTSCLCQGLRVGPYENDPLERECRKIPNENTKKGGADDTSWDKWHRNWEEKSYLNAPEVDTFYAAMGLQFYLTALLIVSKLVLRSVFPRKFRVI